jgi:hypothetical protein
MDIAASVTTNETSKPEDLGPTARREEGQTDI